VIVPRLLVGLVLAVAVAGCQGDRAGARLAEPVPGAPTTTVGQQALEPDSEVPACTAAATKAVVKKLFAAFSAGPVSHLDEFFAPATRFKWYAKSVRPARRLDDDALDRDSLLGYLQRRQARHVNTYREADRSGNFSMLLRRTADDIPGGPQLLGGRGAVDCDSQRLMAVAVGVRPEPSLADSGPLERPTVTVTIRLLASPAAAGPRVDP
jgi:hypothetical protein